MSFGFGIGDIVAAINAVFKIYDKIKVVPDDIRDASEDLEKLLRTLKDVGEVTAPRHSVAHRHASMYVNDPTS
jgi:hypothetical protein